MPDQFNPNSFPPQEQLQDSRYNDAKQKLRVFLIVIIAVRVVYVLFDAVLCFYWDAGFTSVVMNVISALVLFLFAKAIYKGSKPLLWLILIGGVVSVTSNMISGGILDALQNGNLLYTLYIFVLLVSCVIQIVFSVIALFGKDFKYYFENMKETAFAVRPPQNRK